MKVPFVDLQRIHNFLEADLKAALARVVGEGAFILGKEVQAFEEEWAEYIGCKHVIGCSNGTDALVLILRALEIGPGDEVITVSNTFFATVEAIHAVGAKPVLVDVSADNALIDITKIEKAITEKTKAILPVHLYGHPVDFDPISALSSRYRLYCIEDAAQAHGAIYKGKKIGSLGIAAGFSFYPGKNLGALGDAGAITTNDENLAQTIRELRDHGRSGKFSHRTLAWNMRMDGLQAAFLRAKLPYLPSWLEDRRGVAEIYHEQLKTLDGLKLLTKSNDVTHANHLFVVFNAGRDSLRESLSRNGVETGLQYPIACHEHEGFIKVYGKQLLPVTESLARSCISLPIFGMMTSKEVKYVVNTLTNCLESFTMPKVANVS